MFILSNNKDQRKNCFWKVQMNPHGVCQGMLPAHVRHSARATFPVIVRCCCHWTDRFLSYRSSMCWREQLRKDFFDIQIYCLCEGFLLRDKKNVHTFQISSTPSGWGQNNKKQECIPVGRVTPASMVISTWGVCSKGVMCPGMCVSGGVSVQGGVFRGCLPRGFVQGVYTPPDPKADTPWTRR